MDTQWNTIDTVGEYSSSGFSNEINGIKNEYMNELEDINEIQYIRF